MDKLCPVLYKSYGQYTNKRKMLPNIIDGLLPVQKRVILTCHLICKTKWKKTAAVMGEVMSRFHPHSEATGTAEQLVHNGFIDGWGQWGTKIGIEPIGCAAMRYTKLRSNKLIEEIALKYVDYVKWEEDESDPEPVAIPTMLPFCLMQNHESPHIAFGYRSDMPCYKMKDLVARLLFLIGRGPKRSIKPTVFQCTVTGGNIETLLTTGAGKIEVQGKYKLHPTTRIVEVNGWSPRAGKFAGILNKVDRYKNWNLLTAGDIGYIDQTGKGTGKTKILFEVAKLRNMEAIYKRMAEAIPEALKGTLSFAMYVTNEQDEVELASVDTMLLKAYEYHKLAFENYLKKNINKTNEQIVEYQIIDKIRPYVSGGISAHKTNPVKAIQKIATDSGVTIDQVQAVIEKYRIKRLLTINVDMKALKDGVRQLKSDLTNSDTVCINKYDELK